MNLTEYKKFMKVEEKVTKTCELGQLQICELTQLNPIIDIYTGCKIVFDVVHGVIFLLNEQEEIINVYDMDEPFDGVTPEEDDLKEFLQNRKLMGEKD